ncbi:SubName: Full=Uncharacterized protein {ECO:0000313/EMBL:CCA68793.1} [Serendipita indica DSM 11827]|uniref:Uncharacterized protein n=1 Tax=Serendipita indica (strain DSM 11827) TaxID=1109443 RepID=G4TBU1_SERID|nr:SubName: Full=Uncharacterized protein {ECO:0000313/EMBL:CCA68793.1} [Serendipita indica DSM 11827]CCA68793.1 hypothetical protein PIIN_02655 [Serendipita indica DSM 11827]
MSSLFRTLSRGKTKETPPPAFDPEAFKKTISLPRALAPKHIADEKNRQRKAISAQEQQGERSVSPKPNTDVQPSRANHRRNWSWRSAPFMKTKMEIVTLDVDKPLPPIPRSKEIHVTVNRKSMASSYWGCAGPQDAGDVAAMTPLPPTSFKFIEPQPGIRFRNEEEAREACRVIATLRESFFDDCAPDIVDRCGRNCQKCAQRASHTHPSSDEAIPNYRLVVTEVDEDPQGEEIVVDQVSEEEMTEVGHFKAWLHEFGLFFLNTRQGPPGQ